MLPAVALITSAIVNLASATDLDVLPNLPTAIQGLDLDFDYTQKCVVKANQDGSDDSHNIMAAMSRCKKDSIISFQNTTYHIGQAMEWNLENVKIDIKGHLQWSTDIDYWLENSLPIGPGEDQDSYPPAAYQNQTTALIIKGRHLYVEGHGYGTFDGNGQVWYDFVKGESNYPNRPHALVVTATDSFFHGLRFVQPQMWTVTIVSSLRILLSDIFVRAVSTSSHPARNTDGANTLFSDSIVLRRWEVENGDDCFAAKANSTRVLVEDSVFRGGNGIAVGSIGQYPGAFEVVEDLTVRSAALEGTKFAARVKTWTGEQNQWPPNGGGAGLGHVSRVRFEDMTLLGRGAGPEEGPGEEKEPGEAPIFISQCYSNVEKVDCTTSLFEVDNVVYSNITGTLWGSNKIADFHCSEAQGGCSGLVFEDIAFRNLADNSTAEGVKCVDVVDPVGFECNL